MADDLIRYDILVKDALREVIHKVFLEVSKTGLPGEHHFFVTFLTAAPGVKISSRLKKLYPTQITIVVQHQFWDLIVTDTHFEINLSFSNIPEKLVVPFAAIQSFYDPQASFEAAFDLPEAKDEQSLSNATSPAQTNSSSFGRGLAQLDPIKNNSENPKAKKLLESSDADSTTVKTGKVVSLDDFRKKRD